MAMDANTLPATFDTWPETAQAEYLAIKKHALEAEGTIQNIRDQFTDGVLAMKDPAQHNTLTWQAIVLQALNEVYKQAATTLDLQKVLNSVTQIGAELLGATSAYFCNWDDINYKVTVMAEYISKRATGAEREASHVGAIAQRDYAFREKILHEQGYWISHFDDGNLPDAEQLMFEQYNIKSLLYVPMLADDKRMIGYLAIWETREKRVFNQRQLEYAMLIAEQVSGTFRNVQLHQALQQSEARYKLLMNTMREGLVQVDVDGLIEYANEPFGRLMGINPVVLKGQNLNELWSGLASNINAHETQITYDDGREAYVQVSHSPMLNTNGQQVGAVYLYTDVTERREAEKSALALSMERERVQLLTQFVQDTSHEFYTPLSVIGTRAYLLQRKIDDETVKQDVTIIQEQTTTIQSLVKALVTMTALDSVQSLKKRPANLNDIVISSVSKLKSQSKQKLQYIAVNIQPDIAMIACNTEKMSMAIQSVLDNAIRYTQEYGRIDVRLYQQHDTYVLEIQDNGMGMADEVTQAIFQRFYREDAAHSTRGFGLGLAIAKRIIDLHDAQIEVESTIGSGTLFRMVFPMTVPEVMAS